MIEVLLAEGSTPIVVGEAEDLEGIALLVIEADGKSVRMETADATRKPLGTLTERGAEGLNKAGKAIVAALRKNILAWAKEVDVGEFREAPRQVIELEMRALAESLVNTGFYGEEAIAPKQTGRGGTRSGRR